MEEESKTPKGKFDQHYTGESQEELWKELIDIYDDADRQSYGYGLIMNRLKEKFILTLWKT